MSEPFLAEIRMMGFNFAPRGWAFCDGQILPINQNQSLYSLLGTIYGGDGRTSFALPDLRGRVPIHVGQSGGSSYNEGQKGGEETNQLTAAQIPPHNHTVNTAASDGDSPVPIDNSLAGYNNGYNNGTNLVGLTNEVANAGGGQAHNNMQPTMVVNFCIAIQGLFPPRN